jgi:hypothetical protein
MATGPYTADSVPNARKLKKVLFERAERAKSQQKAAAHIYKWSLKLWRKLATFVRPTDGA